MTIWEFLSSANWLQFKNALLFFLLAGMSVVFAMIMWTERERWNEPFFGAMIGIWVFVTGEAGRQVWYWVWRHLGSRPEWSTGYRLTALYVMGFIVMTGAACVIRNFTIQRWGHKAWVLLIVGSIIGAFCTLFIPRF